MVQKQLRSVKDHPDKVAQQARDAAGHQKETHKKQAHGNLFIYKGIQSRDHQEKGQHANENRKDEREDVAVPDHSEE